MQLYRATRAKYLSNLKGLGGSYRDGARWNPPGQPSLYLAFSPSVAMLEMANYLPSPRLVPKDYVMGVYEIPDDAPHSQLGLQDIPADWALFPPYPASTQAQGAEWFTTTNELYLRVPSSAVVGGLEDIALFNPNHAAASEIRVVDSYSDIYNERAFGSV